MKNSDKPTCGDHGGYSKTTDKPCERVEGWGTEFDTGKCKRHRGTSPDGESHAGNDYAEGAGAPENNNNAATHGLHSSVETFYANASEHLLDQYHAVFEAFCTRYERIHGYEPDHGAKQNLKVVSFKLIKQDMAIEYMIEHAVDPEMPLTEEGIEDIGGNPMSVEQLSKVVPLMNQFDREARLKLKDMGLMNDPESEKANATRELGDVVQEALEPQD